VLVRANATFIEGSRAFDLTHIFAPPHFAADTREILQELGVDDPQLVDLDKRGIIAL